MGNGLAGSLSLHDLPFDKRLIKGNTIQRISKAFWESCELVSQGPYDCI